MTATARDVVAGTRWRSRRWHSRGTYTVVAVRGTEVYYESERGARMNANVCVFIRCFEIEER